MTTPKPRSPMAKPSFWPALPLFLFHQAIAVFTGFAYARLPLHFAVFSLLLFVGLALPVSSVVNAYRAQRRLWRAAVRGDAPWQMRSGR